MGQTILRALLHAENRINEPRFEGLNPQMADDARPLRSLDGLAQACGEHALLYTEIELVLVVEVTATTVMAPLHALEVLVQKGTGLSHIGNPTGIAEAAITAEILGGAHHIPWNRPGPFMGSRRSGSLRHRWGGPGSSQR